MYQRVRRLSSHAGLQWHVVCCVNTILVYRCNKQFSNVFLSIQFDTNVSQLLRHVMSWSCDPLPSLGELSSSRLKRLSVCCRVCFDCVSHQWCTVGTYCVSAASKWPFLEKKRVFFIFFHKKNEKKWKKDFFSKKNGLTSGLTRGWRQTSDVSPTPPDGLTSGATTKSGPVSLVMDLHIVHERWGSSSDPSINGHLHYPNDIDRSLNETVTDKIRKYRVDYNNNPPNSTVINFCVFQGGVIQVTCVWTWLTPVCGHVDLVKESRYAV